MPEQNNQQHVQIERPEYGRGSVCCSCSWIISGIYLQRAGREGAHQAIRGHFGPGAIIEEFLVGGEKEYRVRQKSPQTLLDNAVARLLYPGAFQPDPRPAEIFTSATTVPSPSNESVQFSHGLIANYRMLSDGSISLLPNPAMDQEAEEQRQKALKKEDDERLASYNARVQREKEALEKRKIEEAKFLKPRELKFEAEEID